MSGKVFLINLTAFLFLRERMQDAGISSKWSTRAETFSSPVITFATAFAQALMGKKKSKSHSSGRHGDTMFLYVVKVGRIVMHKTLSVSY